MHDRTDGSTAVEQGDFLQLDGLRRRRGRDGAVMADEVDDDGILAVHVEGIGPMPALCPADGCGGRLHAHGHRRQAYADVPHYGRPTRLVVHRRRWRCQSCGTTVPEALPAMDDARRATRRLAGYVQRRCFEQTFTSLGRDIGVSDMTIRAMFGDLMMARARLYRFETPRVLGIDEVKITGTYRLVLTNIERLAMYDMQPSRRMADMRTYFAAFPDRRKVEVFVADLWGNYETIHRTFFPHAALVADRFHVERMATNGMEAFRKAYRKSLTKAQRIRLKDERFLLLRAGRRLSETQRGALAQLFDRHPQMRAAWEVKEAFVGIYGAADRQEAGERLDAWPFSVPLDLRHHYREAISALRSRREHILNWHNHPVTNGYTESVNRLAKSINRMGRGYAFEVVRAKLLYDERAIAKGALVLRRDPHPPINEYLDDLGLATMSRMIVSHRMQSSTTAGARTTRHGADLVALCERLEAGAFDADAVGLAEGRRAVDVPMGSP